MKIEYRTPPGTGSYTILADDANSSGLNDSIFGYQASLAKNPQNDPLAFSLAPYVRDTGNGTWTLSFGVERTHITPNAALLFILTHSAALNVLAELDLKITVGAQVVYFANCVLTRFEPDPHSDQSTRIGYTFVTGRYTTTAP